MQIDYHFFTQFRPLPETQLKFIFPYEFSNLDYEILTKCQAQTGMGFMWFCLTPDDLFIFRGHTFYFSIHLDRKNNHHSAIAYMYPEEAWHLDKYLQNSEPVDALNTLFTRWRKEGLEELQRIKKLNQAKQ